MFCCFSLYGISKLATPTVCLPGTYYSCSRVVVVVVVVGGVEHFPISVTSWFAAVEVILHSSSCWVYPNIVPFRRDLRFLRH
jgi:hypothetical protein